MVNDIRREQILNILELMEKASDILEDALVEEEHKYEEMSKEL